MPLKLEKRENRPFLQNHFALTLLNIVKDVMVLLNRLHSEHYIFQRIQRQQTTDTFNKNKRCHMTLEGLSSVCAKLEPATSKINEIFEINILQKFTSHALFTPQRGLFIL